MQTLLQANFPRQYVTSFEVVSRVSAEHALASRRRCTESPTRLSRPLLLLLLMAELLGVRVLQGFDRHRRLGPSLPLDATLIHHRGLHSDGYQRFDDMGDKQTALLLSEQQAVKDDYSRGTRGVRKRLKSLPEVWAMVVAMAGGGLVFKLLQVQMSWDRACRVSIRSLMNSHWNGLGDGAHGAAVVSVLHGTEAPLGLGKLLQAVQPEVEVLRCHAGPEALVQLTGEVVASLHSHENIPLGFGSRIWQQRLCGFLCTPHAFQVTQIDAEDFIKPFDSKLLLLVSGRVTGNSVEVHQISQHAVAQHRQVLEEELQLYRKRIKWKVDP
ncbi:hypothetical protein EYF80_013680 [Liparis tanakae]|uniref:Uncharacterized protein n=1 Tax=Liparis tanakae TaxID=230148 RepID=A0A4Z2IDI8_9TELE|nr:hypothetical protein EYF80_013680 [Liparis tanakae]